MDQFCVVLKKLLIAYLAGKKTSSFYFLVHLVPGFLQDIIHE